MKKSLNTLANEIIEIVSEKNIKKVSNALWFELMRQKKLSSIEKLFELLEEKQSQREGKVMATVSSARSMTESQLKLVKEKIEKKFNLKADIQEKINLYLLGGLQIKIADEITDYSYRGKIETLRNKIGAG